MIYQLAALFGALALLAVILTRSMISLAPRLGLIDKPDPRRIHTTPIPRAGGLAIFATIFIGFAGLWVLGVGFQGPLGSGWIYHFFFASLILVFIGVIDDRQGMSAWIKLTGQVGAALVMYSQHHEGSYLLGFEIWMPVSLLIHVGWYVALINAFNLIDGMDGLCAGLALISLTILGILIGAGDNPQNALVIAVMGVALAGFLRYNFHPARIFLGDTGSMLIGLFIASVGAATVGRQAVVAGLLLPLLVAGVPLFDVFLAIWRRVARRLAVSKPGASVIRVFGPDRDHLHHRLLNLGFSQRQVAGVLYLLAIVISILALIPTLGGTNLLAISLVGMVVISLVGLRYIAPIELQESGWGLRAIIRRPQGFKVTVCAYFLWDTFVLLIAAGVSQFLLKKMMVVEGMWGMTEFYQISLFAAFSLLGLRYGRAHVRRWTRATIHDFGGTALWLICGAGLSFAIQGMAEEDLSYMNLVFHLCALTLAGAGITLPRCLGFFLSESVVDSHHRRKHLQLSRPKKICLLYGAGDLGELFLQNLRLSPPDKWLGYQFIGFLDDSPELRHRRLGGFRVLGELHHLPEIIARTGVSSIMVTCSALREERFSQLEQLALAHGLEVMIWNPDLSPHIHRESLRTVRTAGPREASEMEGLDLGAGAFTP